MNQAANPERPEPGEITQLLWAHRGDHGGALEKLTPLVYDELRRIAHFQLRAERPGHTLQTTGLVHEAFIRLVEADRVELNDRTHFFALSARVMRYILLDYAKSRRALKRGGGIDMLEFDESLDGGAQIDDKNVEGLIELDRALDKLAEASKRQSRIVECRFFAGMSVEETATALEVSKATVKRDWQMARAWLNRELA